MIPLTMNYIFIFNIYIDIFSVSITVSINTRVVGKKGFCGICTPTYLSLEFLSLKCLE